MSLLAADIGNSHTFIGLLDGDEVTAHWRVNTDERRTADEWSVLLRGLLAERVADVDGIAVCATVPAVLHEWREMLERHFGTITAIVVEPGVRTGIPVMMDNPREVGTDRIVELARRRHPPRRPRDRGRLRRHNDVRRGRTPRGSTSATRLLAGIEISLEALGRRGAQLRKVELVRPRSVIAKNTVEALQSGMLFGVAAPGRGPGRADDRRAGRSLPRTSPSFRRDIWPPCSSTIVRVSPCIPRGSPCRACDWCSNAIPE